MKKSVFLSFTALILIGCGSAAQQTNLTTTNANSAIVESDNSAIVSSHSSDTEKSIAPQTNRAASSESPMARPIDVSEMNAALEKAEKNPKNKQALAKAYFTRAFALTEAAQYRAALGDFRKGLKLDPTDEDAKAMHDKIIAIFKSINREPPKEGEEPAPLPFKKGE